MKNVLIIEDEKLSFEKIEKYCKNYLPEWNRVGPIKSNEKFQELLNMGVKPDLILSDIELLDGNVFKTLENTVLKCPIIFITGNDSFLIDAFKSNGIAYILKPYLQEDFKKAIDKYKDMFVTNHLTPELFSKIQYSFSNQYKERYLVKKLEKLSYISTKDIMYFKSDGNLIFVYDKTNQRSSLNKSLNQLEKELDPKMFFRISRSEIVNGEAMDYVDINLMKQFKIHLVQSETVLKVSIRKNSEFKKWLNDR